MRVLAILYCYPPLLVPAAICYLKLVLGLRRHGVEVEIVTITPESFSAPGGTVMRDAALARVAPADVVEHRFASPETSLGVRVLKRLDRRRRFVYPFLEPKKREWLWPAGRALLRQDLRRFDVVLSCSQPHANHLLGMELQRRAGLPWVAYFSDPWSDNPYAMFPSERVARHNRALEDRVLAAADRVLFTSEEMQRLVLAKHPVLEAAKTGVLPHAFVPDWYVAGEDGRAAASGDDASATASGGARNSGADGALGHSLQPPVAAGFPVRLLHTGHFYGPRTPGPLLESLTRLQARGALTGRLTVSSYGTMPPAWAAMAREGGLQEVLRLENTVPYLDTLTLMRAHDVLLLVDAKLSHWSESVFLPSKLVDYLGAGKPILALTPATGASARVVREVGGTVCDLEDAGAIDRALEALATSGASASPRPQAMQAYEVSRVAGRCVDILAELLRERRGRG